MNKLSVQPTECDCARCSKMCHSPCCGIPEDFEVLINNGYASRLMLDDWPDGETMLKPALKGYEGEIAPWETGTTEGCTFWKEGKCELHSLGLKPIQGRLALHGHSQSQLDEITTFLDDAWSDNKGEKVIEQWKNELAKKE